MQTCEALAEPDHGRTRRRVAAHARGEPRLPAPHGARPPALLLQRQRIGGEQAEGPERCGRSTGCSPPTGVGELLELLPSL